MIHEHYYERAGMRGNRHWTENVEPNDIFVLCSDGLYDMVSDDEIRDILLRNPALKDQCRRLVARALENGGRDNVTVMVIQV